MYAQLQQRIQRYGWDRAAGDYERSWGAQIEPAQNQMLEMAALKPGESVLDVACGTGLITLRAAEMVAPAGWVAGTDISEGMIGKARDEAAKRGVMNVSFHRAAAEALDFPEDSFDAALCSLGLMYVDEPAAVLRHMNRVLKPGGRTGIVVWGRRDRCGWAGIFPVVDARVKTDVCPLFFQLGTGDSLRMVLEEAGFTEVAVRQLTYSLEYASGEEAIAAAFAGGPVAMAYSRFDAATRAGAHAEYLRSIECYRNGDGYSLPGEFVVATANKQGTRA